MIEFTIRSLSLPTGVVRPGEVLETVRGRLTIDVRRQQLAAIDDVPIGIVARRLAMWVPTADDPKAFEFHDDTTGRVVVGISPERFGWRLWSGYQSYTEKRTWPVGELTGAARRFLNDLVFRLKTDPGVNVAGLLTTLPVYAVAPPIGHSA